MYGPSPRAITGTSACSYADIRAKCIQRCSCAVRARAEASRFPVTQASWSRGAQHRYGRLRRECSSHRGLVLVVVATMGSVQVPVVQIVGVVGMLDRRVSALLAVAVGVLLGSDVPT